MNCIEEKDLVISNILTQSGREYALSRLETGNFQYMDRGYKFAYVPDDIKGCMYIKTCGNDKLILETQLCLSFDVNRDVDIYILFADKFPVIPKWLESYERIRKNVTRQDSDPNTLKGYFSLYKRSFPKGRIVFNGCSPQQMMSQEYIVTMGATFCMYSLCVIPS